MGVFQRLSDLLKSNVNDLIDRAEDPEKMVKQIIIDMQTELTKATQNYGKAKASERLAEKKYLEAQKISADWEAKAKRLWLRAIRIWLSRLWQERSRLTRISITIRKCTSLSLPRPTLSAIR